MYSVKSKLEKYRFCTNYVSFDVETTGLRPYHGDRIFSFCFGDADWCCVARIDKPYYALCRTNDILNSDFSRMTIRESTIKSNIQLLLNLFSSNDRAIIIHNCKFEKGFCKVHGIEFPNDLIIHDTMLMSRELDNQSPSHELGKLVHRLGGDPLGKMIECDEKVNKEFKKLGGYQYIDINLMTEYQMYDAVRPLLLQSALYPSILSSDVLLEDYIWEVEAALHTQDMEEDGILIHERNCKELESHLGSEIAKMQHEMFDLISEYINIDSSDQLARILYKKLDFPVLSLTKKVKPSVDKDAIFELQEKGYDHPFLNLVLKWRSYTDGRTNIQSYLNLSDDNGKIHPTINTCQAKTARQSSSKPNLQNVSKEAALKNPYPVAARKCFKCPDECIIYAPDYSGIQFRLIINEAKEEELFQKIKENPLYDCHTPAAEVFYREKFTDKNTCIEYMIHRSPENSEILEAEGEEKAYDIFKKVLRSSAKNANFAKPFYANTSRIAETLMLPLEETQIGMDIYEQRWPNIYFFSQNEYKKAKEHGFLETHFGTKIYAPENELYKIGNYIIQHEEAKIVKRAEVRCMEYFKRKYSTKLINILFPVHDELIIKFNRKLLKDRKEIINEITSIMEYCPEIEIPMKVEWKYTNSTWDRMRKVEIC